MFRRILLPLDLSNRHDRASKLAGELAKQNNGEVVLFHVIETITGLSFDEEGNFYARLEKIARSNLERLAQSLTRDGVRVSMEVHYGHRGPEIVRFANDSAIDLIVLTAPHIDPQNIAEGWGSLSFKVSLFSQCPVLLVRQATDSLS